MRLTVIQWFPLSQFPTKRCLDAAEVTVRVDENADVDITEAREIAAQQSGLFASELKQKGAAAPKEPGRVPQYASEDLGAVRSAVVGERRLECEGVPPVIQARGSPVRRRATTSSRTASSPAAHSRSSAVSSSAAMNPAPDRIAARVAASWPTRFGRQPRRARARSCSPHWSN